MKAKKIISLMIVLWLIPLTACKNDIPTGPDLGEIAPNFTAQNHRNQNVSLSDYFGKVILINFSADWCGPCRDEAPRLEVLYNEYKSRGFQVITLLIDGSPSAWAQLYNLTFPVLNDNNKNIWNRYGDGSLPLNIVVDRDSTIRYKEYGFSESELKAVIEKYL